MNKEEVFVTVIGTFVLVQIIQMICFSIFGGRSGWTDLKIGLAQIITAMFTGLIAIYYVLTHLK